MPLRALGLRFTQKKTEFSYDVLVKNVPNNYTVYDYK